MAISKFRRGETTYICSSCKKRTRNTGDEGNCGLCVDCFDLTGFDNHLSDNGAESMNYGYGEDARRIFNNRPELIPLFDEVYAASDRPLSTDRHNEITHERRVELGMVDHDHADHVAYLAERHERSKPSEY